MKADAKSKFARYSPTKVNQVLSLIRSKSVEKAMDVLRFSPKNAATLISKTLKSAVANAGRLKSAEGLIVKECYVGQGPSLKRMRPGPMGRGMMYKRKMCHLTIVVDEGVIKKRKKEKKENSGSK